MNLARRLFFKRAAGAVAAGPLALEAVAKEVTAMSGVAPGYLSAPPSLCATSSPSYDGEKLYILNRLKEMALGPEKRPVDHVNRLDPDLVANRSMSLVARMRVQAEREAHRYHEREKDSLLKRLAQI